MMFWNHLIQNPEIFDGLVATIIVSVGLAFTVAKVSKQ